MALLTIVLMIVAFSVWSFVALGLDAVSTYRSQSWLANLLFLLPGVGFAVGLLAPRLLRVDRALRWTINWGLWSTAMSALAWAASVALLALPAAPRSWLTAAIVGATARPALWATRRIADITVYGRRPDPGRTLGELGNRLAASVDPRTVPVDIVATVTSSLGLAGAALLVFQRYPRRQERRSTRRKGERSIRFAIKASSLGSWSSFPAPGTLPSLRTTAPCSPRSAVRPRLLCTVPGSSATSSTRALGSCSRAKRSANACVATCTTTSHQRSPASG